MDKVAGPRMVLLLGHHAECFFCALYEGYQAGHHPTYRESVITPPPPPTPLLRCRNKQIKHTYVVELSGRIIFVAYVVMLTVWAKNDDRFPLRQAWLRACKSRMLDDIEKYQTYKYN